jgi:hypothetical protein
MEAAMARKRDAFATPGIRSIGGGKTARPPHHPDAHIKLL